MAFKKLTNESLWNTDQLKGVEKEEIYWALEALKGMSGRENTDKHSILAISDWIVVLNESGEVKLPFKTKGLYFRPGMPPANFEGNTMESAGLLIGHRVS